MELEHQKQRVGLTGEKLQQQITATEKRASKVRHGVKKLPFTLMRLDLTARIPEQPITAPSGSINATRDTARPIRANQLTTGHTPKQRIKLANVIV